MKMPCISTAEEIRTLASRAVAVLDALAEVDDDDQSDAEQRQGNLDWRAAIEALRFCAAAAASLGDASLLPIIAQAIEAREGWNDEWTHDADVLADGVRELVAAGAPVNAELKELATYDDPRVRAAIAEGLAPRNAAAIALLEQLGEDPVAEVRKPAQASLSKAREVPWWMGKFKRDPVAGLSPEEAERLKDTFVTIAAILDDGLYTIRKREAELAEALDKLPARLAIELSLGILCGGSRTHDAALPILGAKMVSREGGAEALILACEAWSKLRYFYTLGEHVQMVADTPPEVRLSACLSLARYAATRDEAERHEMSSPACIAAKLASGAFPPGADLNPLLDIVLAVPAAERREAHEIDYAVSFLGDALSDKAADPGPVAERIVEARLAGYPGAWRGLARDADQLLARIDRARLRAAAEQAIMSENESTLQWGIERLLLDVHDPERDPDPLSMAQRFYEDARTRSALLASYEARKTVLPFWRVALRRGVLPFDEAAILVDAVDDLWGPSKMELRVTTRTPEQREASRQKERERYAAFLGPEETQGAVTEQEWHALRTARETFPLRDYKAWRDALWALPEGAWHPEDWAFLEKALRHCEEEDRGIAVLITGTLSSKPEVSILPIFEKLMKLCPSERGFIRRDLAEARVALGLSEEEEAANEGSQEDEDGGEWMDEDEDDEL